MLSIVFLSAFIYNCFAYEIKPVTSPIQHGEGPHWCSKTNKLYYVDTFKATLYRCNPNENGESEYLKLEGRKSVGFALPLKDKNETFLVFADRLIYNLHWPSNKELGVQLKKLTAVEKDKPTNQFNDGKVDPKGRIWGGTLTRNEDLSVTDNGGHLYMFSYNLSDIEKKVLNTSISNGMAWSKDKKYYFIDSKTRYVVGYNFDEESGRIYDEEIVFNFSNYPDLEGIPDGMTIDENDNLWIALFGGHHILQVNPKSGKILQKIKMPVTYITSVTFGGPNLNILYATTSRLKLNESQILEEPTAGSVFAITKLGVKGVPPHEAIFF